MASVSVMALSSCQEHIDEGARFTFTGNTIATYLEADSTCSSFVEILTRGECIGLMKAYGTYTCFAPTNEAIARFLVEQDSIWRDSKKRNEETNGKAKIIDTGIYSTALSDLSKDKCTEIARNHIFPKIYLGGDLRGNSIPDANMNGRILTLAVADGGVVLVNSEAPIISEEEVENGVVHKIKGVANPSNMDVPTLLDEYDYFSIFVDALEKTGYADRLYDVKDDGYTEGDKVVGGIYEKKGSLSPYPSTRLYGFTVFMESNDVLKKYGITDFNTLTQKCKEWYEHGTKAWTYNKKEKDWEPIFVSHHDTVLANPKNPCHPVNQFIGYHILDRTVSYDNLVCYKIEASCSNYNFNSEQDFPDKADRTEYYVTMNNRILKATMPRSGKLYNGDDLPNGLKPSDIYLNYASSGKGQNIRVSSPAEFKSTLTADDKEYNPAALNGTLNVIDDVLLYNEDIMAGEVLNCIMRFDVSSICSELTNNYIRWKCASLMSSDGDVFIPHNYCERVKVYTENTRLFYLSPHTSWYNYQGDEMMALGLFDFAYLLPPVPEGTYEIRMGYSASGARHLVQVYLDDEVTGIPIDLRLTGDKPQINWKHDIDDLERDEELIAANDKDMKNRGYLKAPMTFYDSEKTEARYSPTCLRAVIATKYLSAGSHWLRFKNVLETDDGEAQFMHDYFEIVPLSYLRDPKVTEEDKRN